MKKISVSVAMPTEGEYIEKLNSAKFEENIKNELQKYFPGVKISVNVFSHDGTGEDEIHSPAEYEDGRTDVENVLSDAISNAFSDETSYDN